MSSQLADSKVNLLTGQIGKELLGDAILLWNYLSRCLMKLLSPNICNSVVAAFLHRSQRKSQHNFKSSYLSNNYPACFWNKWTACKNIFTEQSTICNDWLSSWVHLSPS